MLTRSQSMLNNMSNSVHTVHNNTSANATAQHSSSSSSGSNARRRNGQTSINTSSTSTNDATEDIVDIPNFETIRSAHSNLFSELFSDPVDNVDNVYTNDNSDDFSTAPTTTTQRPTRGLSIPLAPNNSNSDVP
jgi:hypothetical protein